MKTILLCLLSVSVASAVELTKETSAAFDAYIQEFEARNSSRLTGDHFLRLFESGEAKARVLRGEAYVQAGANAGETPVKSGLVHDWAGGIFIPGTTLQHVVNFIQNYSRDKVTYAPDIADSKVLSRNHDNFKVYLRIVKSKLMVTDVLNTEHDIRYIPAGPKRMYIRSVSTRVAEVVNPGKADEKELPIGNDRGLLWRMNGYWFLEERDGGVYAEYETITLSRDIPFGMGHILGPILHNVPAESLKASLGKTRRALTQETISAAGTASSAPGGTL